MRVLNVLYDDRFGGPQKRVIEVAKALAERGVETVLCLPAGSGNTAEIAEDAGILVRRIHFSRIPSSPRNLSRLLPWAALLMRDILRFAYVFRTLRADVVHVNGGWFLAPAFAAKLARTPLVWHLNDVYTPPWLASLLGRIIRLLASRIVASSKATAAHYRVADSLHHIIYPPIDTGQHRPEALRERKRKDRVRRVGLVANWNPLKGIEYFVQAAAIVRERLKDDLEVVLVGAKLETQKAYVQEVSDLIDALGLRPIVRHYDFVHPVAPLVEGLDVLVLSSTSESFGMALLEGMAAGVPVVGTDVGGVREVVLADPENPAGILVPTKDPGAMAAAILRLLQATDEAALMGRNGRRLAVERFSIEAAATRHLAVYRSLARGQREPCRT